MVCLNSFAHRRSAILTNIICRTQSACNVGKGSVPRGRVYAAYAARCAKERITVLNPASFGKLVRVLFPGLKTRRLGVRGESKYHYVNFNLLEDVENSRESSEQPILDPQHGSHTHLTATTPPLPPPSMAPSMARVASQSSHSQNRARLKNIRRSSHTGYKMRSIYTQPDLDNEQRGEVAATSTKVSVDLVFETEHDSNFSPSDPLILPQIGPYLPEGSDPDAAKSLSALYLSHCTSLVECIRYCRGKSFFHLYSSFMGTLTMPVQKLLSNPALEPWIEACDLVLYQRMIRIMSSLTLQVLPRVVLETLRDIAESLVEHIEGAFRGQAPHVIRAKVGTGTLFAALLDRSLRVNLTAHAAANQLSNPANRDQMFLEWLTMIKPRKLAECVPTKGMDDVVEVLLQEMRHLLNPAQVPVEVEMLSMYRDHSTDASRKNGTSEQAPGATTSNVLDRWVDFLRSLPGRFPYASHWELVWCVERIGAMIMRDLTLAQGKSFGSWWVTKVWVDEMMSFMAESGGLMTRTLPGPATSVQPGVTADKDEAERENTNAEVIDGSEETSRNETTSPQLGRAPFPPANQSAMEVCGADGHDDSGIGIRTPEEEFSMEKFAFTETPVTGSAVHV